MSNPIPQIGSVVRFGVWNGVVLDVFESSTSTKHIIQIMFAKNVYKRQPAELHILEDLGDGLLVLSTKEALKEELSRYNSSALAEADQLLEKVVNESPNPVETEAKA
jgi:hypothetical protein